MNLIFECTYCGKDIDYTTTPPDSIPKNVDGSMTTEDVVCPECESVYTVECYFGKEGYIGCQTYDYGWYMKHGDEEFTVNI